MFSIRRFVRPVALGLALALSAVPAAALAGSKDGGAEAKKGHAFPMPAASFNQLIEKRITKAREHLTRKMDKHNLPAATKTQAKKDFEDGATAVRALSAKVGADGTVTKDEAKQVRSLVKEMQQKAREKYGLGKGKDKRKGKNKDKVPA